MIQKSSQFFLTAIAICAVASCTSKPVKEDVATTSYASDGSVKAEIVAAPEGSRYEITPGVSYLLPEPAAQNAIPEYPPELLAKRLDPIEVIARVIVNEAGAVQTATLVQSSSPERVFADRTLATVKTWTFIPLKRVEGLNAEPIPFTQEYRFTFKQINGHAIVESGVRQ